MRNAICGNHRHVVFFGMQVPIIWVCLVLEAWALAIQVARLYHTYLNQDRVKTALLSQCLISWAVTHLHSVHRQ